MSIFRAPSLTALALTLAVGTVALLPATSEASRSRLSVDEDLSEETDDSERPSDSFSIPMDVIQAPSEAWVLVVDSLEYGPVAIGLDETTGDYVISNSPGRLSPYEPFVVADSIFDYRAFGHSVIDAGNLSRSGFDFPASVASDDYVELVAELLSGAPGLEGGSTTSAYDADGVKGRLDMVFSMKLEGGCRLIVDLHIDFSTTGDPPLAAIIRAVRGLESRGDWSFNGTITAMVICPPDKTPEWLINVDTAVTGTGAGTPLIDNIVGAIEALTADRLWAALR